MTVEALAGGTVGVERAPGRWREIVRQVLRSWSGRVGAILAALIIVMAVFAPLIAPYGPTEILLDPARNEKVLERPCIHLFGCADSEVQHIMGTDSNGRDVYNGPSPPSPISHVTYQALSGLSASSGRCQARSGAAGAVCAYSSSTASQLPNRPVTNGLKLARSASESPSR